jgi:hypothetical protein
LLLLSLDVLLPDEDGSGLLNNEVCAIGAGWLAGAAEAFLRGADFFAAFFGADFFAADFFATFFAAFLGAFLAAFFAAFFGDFFAAFFAAFLAVFLGAFFAAFFAFFAIAYIGFVVIRFGMMSLKIPVLVDYAINLNNSLALQ